MKNFLFIFLCFLITSGFQLQAKNGIYVGGYFGSLGGTSTKNISVKYEDNSDVPSSNAGHLDVDNLIASKLQLGYKHDLHQNLWITSSFGYSHRTTMKKLGTRAKINLFDISVSGNLGFYGVFGKLAIHFPLINKVSMDIDNRALETLQGGQLEAKGSPGFDTQLGYYILDDLALTLGYSWTKLMVDQTRVHSTNNNKYRIKFNIINTVFTFGFNYIIPLSFLNPNNDLF